MTPPRRTAGFTLVELMIAVAIVGILAVIAYPSYVAYIQKSHRADAKSALVQVAQYMERRLSEQGTYSTADIADVYPSKTSDGGYYALAFASKPTDSSYTITATPQGTQAGDACGTFTYNDQGVKGVSGGSVTDPAQCW